MDVGIVEGHHRVQGQPAGQGADPGHRQRHHFHRVLAVERGEHAIAKIRRCRQGDQNDDDDPLVLGLGPGLEIRRLLSGEHRQAQAQEDEIKHIPARQQRRVEARKPRRQRRQQAADERAKKAPMAGQ